MPLLLLACQRDVTSEVVIVGPNMADPFSGAMGATTVRAGFEGDPGSIRTVSTSPGSRFNLDVRPTDPRTVARLRVDVLRDRTIIAQGATPPVAWINVGSQRLTVFVQPSDSVALAPGGAMIEPRADFALVSAGGRGAVAFTIAQGRGDARPDWYFLPSHKQQPYTFTVSSAFDGDTSVVPLPEGSGVLLLRAERAVVTNDTSSGAAPSRGIPPERRVLRGASVASDVDFAYVLGGRPEMGPASPRIDRVDRLGEIEGVPYALATGRNRPGVLRLAPRTASAAPRFLVYGGQDPTCASCPALELWSPGSAGVPISTTVASMGASVDRRSEFAAVCVQFDQDQNCAKVLILGGVDNATGALATKDILLDGTCLRGLAPMNCAGAELELLSARRRGIRATIGVDGRRVVVTGGRDAAGSALYSVDVIDASDVATLRLIPGTREITNADPAVLGMADGSVMIAGGIDRTTMQPSGAVWFVRGPIAPLPM
jgi:hypothetical protein